MAFQSQLLPISSYCTVYTAPRNAGLMALPPVAAIHSGVHLKLSSDIVKYDIVWADDWFILSMHYRDNVDSFDNSPLHSRDMHRSLVGMSIGS